MPPKNEQRIAYEKLRDACFSYDHYLAHELARDYLAKYPHDPFARMILGETLTSLQRYDEARKELDKALRAAIDKPYRHLIEVSIGHLYNHKGDYHTALRWYQKALKSPGGPSTEIYVFIGHCFSYLCQNAEAKHSYRSAIRVCQKEKQPNSSADEAYYNLAACFAADRNYTKALEYVDHALRLDPKYKIAKTLRKNTLAAIKYKSGKAKKTVK